MIQYLSTQFSTKFFRFLYETIKICQMLLKRPSHKKVLKINDLWTFTSFFVFSEMHLDWLVWTNSFKINWNGLTRTSMVKRRVMEQTMPAEETGTGSANTHEYKNHGNGSLKFIAKLFKKFKKLKNCLSTIESKLKSGIDFSWITCARITQLELNHKMEMDTLL